LACGFVIDVLSAIVWHAISNKAENDWFMKLLNIVVVAKMHKTIGKYSVLDQRQRSLW